MLINESSSDTAVAEPGASGAQEPRIPMTALICQGMGVISVVIAILATVVFLSVRKTDEVIWSLSAIPGGVLFWALGDIVEGVWRK